jgi:AraC family transcriptional regulator, regulatory protein of adaptative response / DNA-3-methyladenine glycosylase II
MAPDCELRLSYQPPCDVAGLLEFLAARAVDGVEEVADGAYRRSLRLPHGSGVVQVGPDDGAVRARFWLADRRDLEAAAASCRRLLDLDRDPRPIIETLGDDEVIGSIVRGSPGRRVPGSVEGSEIAIRAVLGQQVSLRGACTLAGRLVAAFGEPLRRPVGAVTHLFPAPAALAAADPERLPMPKARGRALIGLARALAGGDIALADATHADPEEVERRLLGLPGIGPWTTGYVAMRALHDPDAFMPTDLGVRRALALLGCDGRPSGAVLLSQRWRPYRAYATQHLWAHLVASRAGAPS